MPKRHIAKRHIRATKKTGGSRLIAIVSENIKRYRRFKNLKQSDLARAANVTQAALSNLESKKRSCSLEVLEKIANALDVQPAALLMPPQL